MLGLLRRRWLTTRALTALEVHLKLPLGQPLADSEASLLRDAVNRTVKDGGTSIDVAFRVYAAMCDTHLGQGGKLDDLWFDDNLDRLFVLRGRTEHYLEHQAILAGLSRREKAIAELPHLFTTPPVGTNRHRQRT